MLYADHPLNVKTRKIFHSNNTLPTIAVGSLTNGGHLLTVPRIAGSCLDGDYPEFGIKRTSDGHLFVTNKPDPDTVQLILSTHYRSSFMRTPTARGYILCPSEQEVEIMATAPGCIDEYHWQEAIVSAKPGDLFVIVYCDGDDGCPFTVKEFYLVDRDEVDMLEDDEYRDADYGELLQRLHQQRPTFRDGQLCITEWRDLLTGKTARSLEDFK